MVDAATVAVVAGLLLVQSILIVFFIGRKPRSANTAAASKTGPAGPAMRGRAVVPSDFRVRGRVELKGDLVVRPPPQAKTAGRPIELDVPTDHVDEVLRSFRDVGYEAHETGLTVDTDEGEETLTTLRLDLASLTRRAEPVRPEDRLIVHGDVLIEAGAVLQSHLEAGGKVELADATRVMGDVHAAHIVMRAGVVVDGEASATGDVEVGPGSRAKVIRSGGEVGVAGGFPKPRQPISASRGVRLDLPPTDE